MAKAIQIRNIPDLHAPHLIDLELLHVLSRLVASGDLQEHRADDVRTDFRDLVITRYPHEPLADRIWELRHNVTAYDAAFIAPAEALDYTLITCDVGAMATGHRAHIDLFGEPG